VARGPAALRRARLIERLGEARDGGNVLLWKVITTTIVFALAGLEVFLAARFWA
jgi:hypothetical protein